MELLESARKRVTEILEDAKELIGIKDEDIETLKSRKDILLSWADDLMDEFYNTLINYPKTAKVFEKVPLERVKAKNKRWYEQVVSGEIDRSFYEFQFFVGIVHVYWGIENDIMIFMANRLKMHFLKKSSQHFEPEEAVTVFHAFSKIVDFLIALTVEGYIFTLREALIDIAGFTPGLVDNMMSMKLEELYNLFQNEFSRSE